MPFKNNPKLLPVLIPRPLWGVNAHRLLDRQQWSKIRRNIFSRDNHRCVICEALGQLECHEVFTFDDAAGVAMLVKLESRCPDCHDCHHLGRLKKHNPTAFKQALKRIAGLNGMTPAEVIALVKKAFEVHAKRTRPWEMKVVAELLQEYPELKKLEGCYAPAVRNSETGNAPGDVS